jgi:hypothetical protein
VAAKLVLPGALRLLCGSGPKVPNLGHVVVALLDDHGCHVLVACCRHGQLQNSIPNLNDLSVPGACRTCEPTNEDIEQVCAPGSLIGRRRRGGRRGRSRSLKLPPQSSLPRSNPIVSHYPHRMITDRLKKEWQNTRV